MHAGYRVPCHHRRARRLPASPAHSLPRDASLWCRAFGKMKKMDTYELAALALLVLPMLAMVAGYCASPFCSRPAAIARARHVADSLRSAPPCAVYKPEVAQQLTQCATSCSAMSGVGSKFCGTWHTKALTFEFSRRRLHPTAFVDRSPLAPRRQDCRGNEPECLQGCRGREAEGGLRSKQTCHRPGRRATAGRVLLWLWGSCAALH